MREVLRTAREKGVMTLIFCNDVDFAKPRIEEGWDVVAVGTDTGWLSSGAAATKEAISPKA